ncbi:MAG TPA: hypothetical protein VGK96_01885 [Candidatus Sulfotelmatobacter sp.]
MPVLPEIARAYLEALEAERQAALTLSEQKAEEAKLIRARQEGFQAAVEMLSGELPSGDAGADPQRGEPMRRRGRRPIREMILRKLSFSGEPMTTAQIARAISYVPERTEKALERMEKRGHVLRNEDRWTIGTTPLSFMNESLVSAPSTPESRGRAASTEQPFTRRLNSERIRPTPTRATSSEVP